MAIMAQEKIFSFKTARTIRNIQLSSTLSLLFLVFLACNVEAYKDGLYSTDTDFVKPLNADSFQAEVINSRPNLIWIVEFYNSWCGRCIHFAPTWKKLAKEMKDWVDIVVIAGIDCSQSVNIKPCRDFDIKSYPTMKMFPPAGFEKRLEKVAPIKTQSLEQIKPIILDFMTEFTPEAWPRLKPLEKMEELWHEKDVQNSQVFIVFEEKESQVGRQVVLDMRSVTGIKVRIMLKDQVTKFGITEFPSLYKLNPDSTYTKLAVGKGSAESDRQKFVKHIKEDLKSQPADALRVISEGQQKPLNQKSVANAPSMNGNILKAHVAPSNR